MLYLDQLATAPRMLLVFAHLLLCVFALHRILVTDWAVLRSRVSAGELLFAHRQVLALLIGLWLTGGLLAGIDLGWDLSQLPQRPKLIAKLLCVAALTLNGVFLRLWCFPRLSGEMVLSRTESTLLVCSGALSTTSWLMAAFFGIARPMQAWPVASCLAVYALALLIALPVALALERRLWLGRLQRQHGQAHSQRRSVRLARAQALEGSAEAAAEQTIGLEAAAH